MKDLGFTEGMLIGPSLAAAARRRRGEAGKVFDWDKAARRIIEEQALEASAGLAGDWPSTSGDIWRDGKPVPSDETYTYLASAWATPELEIDGNREACWIAETDTEWDCHTYWPESALAILRALA
jgi:hypothetical protein